MKNKKEKILVICIITLCLLYLFIGLIYKPIICSDAINGMISLHNYINGAEWNKTLSLSADGTHISSHELTWWAPGQYQIPFMISKLCSINIGLSLVVLMFASISGGCFFYYKIFTLSSLGNKTILCALLILLLQRFINIYFIQYNSSDLILFFYTPFYIYTYYHFTKTYQQKLFFKVCLLTLLNIAGLFIKNSFILFELAVNIFLIAEPFLKDKAYGKTGHATKRPADLFKESLILLPFIIANLLNYYFFLRLGSNPAQGNGLAITVSTILNGAFLPIVEIMFASLSISGIYGIFYQRIALSQPIVDILIMSLLLFTGYIIYKQKNGIVKLFRKDIIFRIAIISAVIYVIFWVAFTIKQSAVSNEDRLFLPVTILIFPYLLDLSLKTASKTKFVYFAFISISVIYGIYTFAYRIKKYTINGSVFSKNSRLNGFKIYSDNKDSMTELDKVANIISQNFARDYVIVSNPDIAFELNIRNKFIVNSTTSFPRAFPFKQNMNYIIVIKVGKDSPPTGLNKIYSSDRYILFKSN